MIREPVLQFCASAAAAPRAPGAYILRIELAAAVTVAIARRPVVTLPPGRYFYCGSAHGPGGLRARLARHLRHGKSVHWHVDQLTERGTISGVWIAPGGRECDLVALLEPLPAPIPGFGSSDCRHCRSHLLRAPDPSVRRRAIDLKLTNLLGASCGSPGDHQSR